MEPFDRGGRVTPMQTPTTCGRSDAQLDAWLDGDLDDEAARTLERHLQECASCREVTERARRVLAGLRSLPIDAPTESFFERALTSAAEPRPAARRSPRIVAVGFLGAFATTILTVILTGLNVRAPGPRPYAEGPSVALTLGEAKTVNLVFTAKSPLQDVAMSVELPAGIELAGHGAAREVDWRTRLSAGNNLLPLSLVAANGRGGSLVARLKHGQDEKVFVVNVRVEGNDARGVKL